MIAGTEGGAGVLLSNLVTGLSEGVPSVNALYRDFKAAGLEVLLIDFREDPALGQTDRARAGLYRPSTARKMPTIWLSVNRDVRMGCSSPPGESLLLNCLPGGKAYATGSSHPPPAVRTGESSGRAPSLFSG
jgi:hypothetical protein